MPPCIYPPIADSGTLERNAQVGVEDGVCEVWNILSGETLASKIRLKRCELRLSWCAPNRTYIDTLILRKDFVEIAQELYKVRRCLG